MRGARKDLETALVIHASRVRVVNAWICMIFMQFESSGVDDQNGEVLL